jgi:hypothetical protein
MGEQRHCGFKLERLIKMVVSKIEDSRGFALWSSQTVSYVDGF